MRTLFIILLVNIVPSLLFADNINFIWDPNVEPDLAGYRLYRSTQSGQGYVMILEIPCGPNDITCSECTDAGVPAGEYFWVATAFDTEGFESDYSVEQTTVVLGNGEIQNLRIISRGS
ncbi:MAG: hypothetical protein DRQ42_00110 [Gammaproteobacteria bacterium]|nr:MAG: hypothetical protein DRQ42_00110 [Gammaproteobacteria bacterium]